MNGRRGFGIAALMGAWLWGAPAVADSMLLLHPIDDALVASDSTLVDHNYGAEPLLVVWANYPVFGARSYLKFDLERLPAGETVSFARLNLFQFQGGGYSYGIDVFRVADDAWSESTLTWNVQPVLYPAAADLVSYNPLTGREEGWVSFDLLANGAWDTSLDLAPGDGRISLIVRITGGEVATQRAHDFCSDEGGLFDCLLPGEPGPVYGRSPQLVIGTPEPGSGAMLGAGAALLAIAGGSPHRRTSCRRSTSDRGGPIFRPGGA